MKTKNNTRKSIATATTGKVWMVMTDVTSGTASDRIGYLVTTADDVDQTIAFVSANEGDESGTEGKAKIWLAHTIAEEPWQAEEHPQARPVDPDRLPMFLELAKLYPIDTEGNVIGREQPQRIGRFSGRS